MTARPEEKSEPLGSVPKRVLRKFLEDFLKTLLGTLPSLKTQERSIVGGFWPIKTLF
jgi:hypothetical protein